MESSSNNELIKQIKRYEFNIQQINPPENDTATVLYYIRKLSKLPIKLEELEKTSIGKTINILRKRQGIIGAEAKSLVVKWKSIAKRQLQEKESVAPQRKPNNNCHSDYAEFSSMDGCSSCGERVCIPEELCQRIIQELHGGHLGLVKCKNLGHSYVYWPTLDADIVEMIEKCVQCRSKARNPDNEEPHAWETPTAPWQRLHFDIGTFEKTDFLVIVDAHTFWPEAYILNSLTAAKVIECFQECFSRFGIPITVVSDNAPHFTGDDVKKYFDEIGIWHITSPPYQPQSKRLAERFVQTLKSELQSSSGPVYLRLMETLIAYRRTANATTNKSPCELMFGRNIRTTIDLAQSP